MFAIKNSDGDFVHIISKRNFNDYLYNYSLQLVVSTIGTKKDKRFYVKTAKCTFGSIETDFSKLVNMFQYSTSVDSEDIISSTVKIITTELSKMICLINER